MPSMPKDIASTYATRGHWRPIWIILGLSVSKHYCYPCLQKAELSRSMPNLPNHPPGPRGELEDGEKARIACAIDGGGHGERYLLVSLQ